MQQESDVSAMQEGQAVMPVVQPSVASMTVDGKTYAIWVKDIPGYQHPRMDQIDPAAIRE